MHILSLSSAHLLEEIERLGRSLQAELALLALAGHRVDARLDLGLGRVHGHDVEFADDEGGQVRGHLGSLAEGVRLETRVVFYELLSLQDRRVADGHHVRALDQGNRALELECGLEGRLVPAGERPAGVSGLELRSA